MSIRNLDSLFNPSSIAIIGASERAGAIGQVVTRNILEAPFSGPVMLVNPARRELFGRTVYADVASLPETPELAVICTPAEAAVKVVAELAARGTRAAVVIAAGFAGGADSPGGRLRQALLDVLLETCTPLAGSEEEGLLRHQTGDLPHGNAIDVSLIYGDHYFMETLYRLADPEASTVLI